jgi:hypothetical protein
MNEEEPIVNRVSSSSLLTFDLEEFYTPGERVLLDIKDQLYKGLVLREKDFRDYVKNTDWSFYRNKFVAITCSDDAIVPTWAFMILGIALEPFASQIVFGNLETLEEHLFKLKLSSVNWEKYIGQKVVVKGCSKYVVPPSLYVEVAVKLRPFVVSLMFG